MLSKTLQLYNKRYGLRNTHWTSEDIEQFIYLRGEEKMTLKEIGEIAGVSKERIRQLIGNTGLLNRHQPGFRRCYACYKELPLDSFYKNGVHQSKCIKCLKKQSLKWGKIYSYKYGKGGIYYQGLLSWVLDLPMRILVDYKIVKKVWRRKVREVYIPIYQEIGKGASKERQIKAKER